MSIEIYPSVAKVKRNGAYQSLPGFVQQSSENDAQAMIANAETSTTAQYAHANGSYFRLNGTLYQADADIRVNDSIAVGTNCHVAVLANDVFEIEKDVTEQSDRIDTLKNYTEVNCDPTVYYNQTVLIGSSSNKWESKSAYNSVFIEVPKGAEKVKITAPSGYAVLYALLKNSIHTASTVPNYATGGSRASISAGTSSTITIPSDCECIWIWRGNGNTNNTPASIVYYVDRVEVDETKLDGISIGLKFKKVLAEGVQLNAATPPATATVLFTSDDVSVGDKIEYSIIAATGTQTGTNIYIELQDSENTRISIYGKTSASTTATEYTGTFVIPTGFSRAVLNGINVGGHLEYVGIVEENVISAHSPSFNGTPDVIFENDGADAISGVDDGCLNCVSVVKVNDSLYYMYYEAFAVGESGYANASLCFAYSTDGENFTKGFPQGTTAPISGTTLVLPKGTNHGACVVKVPDKDYPFRMIGVIGTDSDRITKMWKSADGINWSLLRQITDGYNDSFTSCVVRGNMLKIFLRTRDATGRAVGVVCTDLDGNRYCGSWNYEFSLEDAKHQIYQASASALDDKREILLPTIYNPNTSEQDVYCFILDGDNLKKVTLDTSSVITNDVKSIYFGCGMVDIGRKMYAFYTTRDTDHDHTTSSTKSAIRRVEVTDTTITNVVRPSS